MKALLILLFATMGFAQAATPPVGTATTLVVTWTPVTAPAGTTVTQYTATISAPGGGAPAAIPACTGAAANNCIAPGAATSTFNYVPGGALYYGEWTISIVANGTTSAGQVLASPPGTGTAVYAQPPVTTLPAPGGVTIQFTIPATPVAQ